MATFSVSSVLILFVFFCAVTQETTGKYRYEGEKSYLNSNIEFHPIRNKRYVAGAINRLSDNYHKGYTVEDSKQSSYRRAEFLGSLAVSGQEETNLDKIAIHAKPQISSPSSTSSTTAPPIPDAGQTTTSTEVPDKSTKKPVDTFTKKHTDIEKNNEKATNTTSSDPDDMDEFPKEVTNNTLVKHNITQKEEDHHLYYMSEFISGEHIARHYWSDLVNEEGVIVNQMLSESHRRAATVRLSFDFPFYGHIVRNMTIATGGFLYTGDYIHSWLAATQYIAPLMANFDTSISEYSYVKYRDNGTSFTVEWTSVSLQDKKDAGPFTFQVTLHKNGDIVFIYKHVPISIDDIADIVHPVKVGLSDAYIIDKTVFYIRKKTIYEYHRVAFNKNQIGNWSAIYIKALPTCVSLKDCNSCTNHNTSFTCKWCVSVNRCSSGHDRFHQEWINNNCPATAVSESEHCSKSTHQRDTSQTLSVDAHSHVIADRETRLGHSGILGLLLVVSLLVCLGLWVFHGYRNPHTRFGQMLIKYRPSQWRLRRGEARYTAATIHM